MNDLKELSIITKWHELAKYLHPVLLQFPKSEKLGITKDIRGCLNNVLRLVVLASKKHHKKNTLLELDAEIAILQYFIRLAYELKFLPVKKYEVSSSFVTELGRMTGGWIKQQDIF